MESLSEDSFRYVVSGLAKAQARFGEFVEEAELILPTPEFFPDDFSVGGRIEGQNVLNLLERMAHYSPLSQDTRLGISFTEGDSESGGGGCGSTACGTGEGKAGRAGVNIAAFDNGYGVVLDTRDVGDPHVLTSTLARQIGAMVLVESGEEQGPDMAADSELAAVSMGFGVLLLSGSCVYAKGCGGLKKHSATILSTEELACAVALFARMHDVKPSEFRGHLATTQRAVFDEILPWVDGNDAIIEALRAHPETLADGVFTIEKPKGLLASLFGRKKKADLPEMIPVKRSEKSEDELKKLAETRALVDAALRD